MNRLLSFQVSRSEDLLVWADLWEDEGLPTYGEVLRFAAAQKRWPKQHRDGSRSWLLAKKWIDYQFAKTSSLIVANDYRIPHPYTVSRVRKYASNSAAFLDLVFNRIS